mmetsp:Transcript_13596/g.53657  ORF Transcript_13596/g.53657 Transcript_13596/m.53657 type:complete len:374 (-) Transcript_13596:2122-3243(-)
MEGVEGHLRGRFADGLARDATDRLARCGELVEVAVVHQALELLAGHASLRDEGLLPLRRLPLDHPLHGLEVSLARPSLAALLRGVVLAGEVPLALVVHELLQRIAELLRDGAQRAALRSLRDGRQSPPRARGVVGKFRKLALGSARLRFPQVGLDEPGVVREKLEIARVRALGHVRAVLAVLELHHGSVAVADGVIVVHPKRLEVLDHAPLQVPRTRRLDRGVDEALAAGHGVEEELGGSHPAEERVGDETLRRRGLLAPFEVRQRSLGEPVWRPHAPHGLLPDARHHLRDVDGRSLAATERHDERRVVARELVEAHVPGGFSHRRENSEHLRLQGLLGVAPRLQRERAPLESLDALVAGVVAAVDHLALLVL